MPDNLSIYYANSTIIAGHIEAEWSDYFLNSDEKDGQISPLFFEDITSYIAHLVKGHDLRIERLGDVGSALGRASYELIRKLDSVKYIANIEPATELHFWAKKILTNRKKIIEIPTISTIKEVENGFIKKIPFQSNKKKIDFINKYLKDIPKNTKFDAIICLNVIDRVINPNDLLQELKIFLKPGGLLVLSSPLSFDVRFTPDKSLWIANLNDLFLENEWVHLDDFNIQYNFRRHKREKISYLSQVVAKVKV
jgi:SAM-dependent methyltransferase